MPNTVRRCWIFFLGTDPPRPGRWSNIRSNNMKSFHALSCRGPSRASLPATASSNAKRNCASEITFQEGWDCSHDDSPPLDMLPSNQHPSRLSIPRVMAALELGVWELALPRATLQLHLWTPKAPPTCSLSTRLFVSESPGLGPGCEASPRRSPINPYQAEHLRDMLRCLTLLRHPNGRVRCHPSSMRAAIGIDRLS